MYFYEILSVNLASTSSYWNSLSITEIVLSIAMVVLTIWSIWSHRKTNQTANKALVESSISNKNSELISSLANRIATESNQLARSQQAQDLVKLLIGCESTARTLQDLNIHVEALEASKSLSTDEIEKVGKCRTLVDVQLKLYEGYLVEKDSGLLTLRHLIPEALDKIDDTQLRDFREDVFTLCTIKERSEYSHTYIKNTLVSIDKWIDQARSNPK